MAALDDLNNIVSIIGGMQGTSATKKGSSTSTQQTKVSDQGINQLITQILSGPGGVANIGGAARRSGLYNSTTEQTQLGNLYATAANQAELARSPTVTTNTGTEELQQPGVGVGSVVGTIGAMQGGKMIMDMLGGEGAMTALADTGVVQGLGNLLGIGGQTVGAAGAGASAAGGLASGMTSTGAALSGAGGAGGAAAGGAAAGSAAGGAAGSAAGSSGFGMNLGTAVPLGGSFLSGILGGKDAAQDPTSLAMNAAMGAMAMGPVGLLAAPLASIAGGLLKGKSVICTALRARGLVSEELYDTGHEYLYGVSYETHAGYLEFGVPIARKINEGSMFWIRTMTPVVRSYLKLLSTPRRLRDYLRYPIGTICHFIGEPACRLIYKVSNSHVIKGA